MANQKMSCKKRPIELIEEHTSRMIRYAKRRVGLLKKAYELSVLCETDMALLMASPSGKLTWFAGSGKSRIEDILTKFIMLADDEREFPLENKEQLCRLLEKVKAEDACATIECGVHDNQYVQENLQTILKLHYQIESTEEQLRLYYPEPSEHKTMGELEGCEKGLLETMDRVSQRMHYLSSRVVSRNDQQPTKNQTSEQALSSTSRLQDIHSVCCKTHTDNYNILDNNQMTSQIYKDEPFPSQLHSCQSMFHKNGESDMLDHYAQCPPLQHQTDGLMFVPDKIQLLSSPLRAMVSPDDILYKGLDEDLKGINKTSS